MEIPSVDRIEPGYDVLAVNAHPDDIEMAAGGTLLKLVASGKRVLSVVFTKGDAGRHGTVDDRVQEMRRAADFGGYDFLFLDSSDCQIFYGEETRDQAIRIIRRSRAALVLAPYHTNFQGTRDGLNHEDHLAVGKIVTAAIKLCRVAKIVPDFEPWLPERLAYFMIPRFTSPSFIVDVTAEEDRLRQLISCFSTQLNINRSGKPILDVLMDWRRLLGYSVGIGLGEGFLVEEPLLIAEPGGLCRRLIDLN